MCQEYVISHQWAGGGCVIGKCDWIEYRQVACDEKPPQGIRLCHRYQRIDSASKRKKGPRPGHNHEA